MSIAAKNEIIAQLQRDILSLQGNTLRESHRQYDTGLGPIEKAFPANKFPIAAVHEFISTGQQSATATNGFISGLLGSLVQNKGACLWISGRRTIYPPALRQFGIAPEQIIFIDVHKPKEILWVVEEALKCDSLSAVVGELTELSFTESRRLQLAVEKSKVTGFIHRFRPRTENIVACVSRWKIKPLPGELEAGMPGVGLPRWEVQLQKVRNGKPGTWQVEWANGGFRHLSKPAFVIPGPPQLMTG